MGVDLIDYTYLQKRGLIKKTESSSLGLKADTSGYVDIGPALAEEISASSVESYPSSSSINSTANETSTSSSNDSSNPLAGFFGGMESTASSTTSDQQTTSYYSNETANSVSLSNFNSDAMKSKLDDLELKLNSITEKLEIITSKLLNFENKVGG